MYLKWLGSSLTFLQGSSFFLCSSQEMCALMPKYVTPIWVFNANTGISLIDHDLAFSTKGKPKGWETCPVFKQREQLKMIGTILSLPEKNSNPWKTKDAQWHSTGEKAMAFFGLWLKLFSFYVKPFSCDKNFQSKSQREQQDLRDTSGLKFPTRKNRNKREQMNLMFISWLRVWFLQRGKENKE